MRLVYWRCPERILPKIAILLDQPDTLYHFQGILKHLSPEEADVVLMGPCRSLFSSESLAGRHCADAADLLAEQHMYQTLVSTNYLGRAGHFFWADQSPYHIQLLGARNVRMMYSLAVGRWNYAEWNRIYDAVIGFGPHDAQRLAFCKDTRVYQVGYPRYDRYFDGSLNRETILAELGCDPCKKTVVWLPTYQNICSIDLHAEKVRPLQERYNLIVKPHPSSFVSETERIRLLERLGFNRIIRGMFDNLKLFRAADWVLSDYSGTAFGAIYTNRPLLLLDVPGAADHPQVGPDSPDILIRSTLAHIRHDDVRPLEGILEDAALWLNQMREQGKWREHFFASHDGGASRKAADTLREIHASTSGSPVTKERRAIFLI